MGGPWWRRARHEWRPEDLPQIRVRRRGVGERGSSGGAANLGISRSPPATGRVRLWLPPLRNAPVELQRTANLPSSKR